MFDPISYKLWFQDKAAFAKAIGASFRETGFVVISDHIIVQDVIDDVQAASEAFFALHEATKKQYFSKSGGGQRGYTPFGTESAKGETAIDLKEFWHTGRALTADSPYHDIMPPTPSIKEITGFDRASRGLFDAMDEFGRDILKGIAIYLELDEDYFEDKVEQGNSILRLIHYPAQDKPFPEGSMRAAAHEDINVITLLLGAEEAGLQVKHRSGEWLSVNPPAGTLVINCGDMLQRLTAGYLPSTSHRVLNPTADRAHLPRYSMPFFLHFNPDFLIDALPGCEDKGGKIEPAITAQDYLHERLVEIGLIKKA
ncbi:MAG: isopenicillin N synthase family oxygenase [Hellea sp.]|nr:isopenicillin N synthase family oxygenase [Hellea sp.]